MMIAKFLGCVDIIVGTAILFHIQSPIFAILFLIMLVKGLMSLMADNIGKLYGIIDILGGIIILFGFDIDIGFSILFFLFFVYKGVVSLLA